MIVQYNSEEKVDLKAPVFVDEDFVNDLASFFKSIRKDVKIQDVSEVERFTGTNREDKPSKRWTPEELILLLDIKIPLAQLVKKFDRSETSISMQKAQFVPSFLSWCKKKGYTNPSSKLITEYLEARE